MSQVLSNLTPYIPNSAKFCSILCSRGRLTLLSTSGPNWTGKVGLGPRSPLQEHSARLLNSFTHGSPWPLLPFLVLSTHPYPPPSSASSDWSVVRRSVRRLVEAFELSALLPSTVDASLPALRHQSPLAVLRCSRVPELKPESVRCGCGGDEVAVYLWD